MENNLFEFLSWPYLLTSGGAVAVTVFIVQFLKLPLDKVWKIPTQYFVYVIALISLTVASYFTGQLTLETFALAVFNSVLVALAAMGLYEKAIKNPEEARILKDLFNKPDAGAALPINPGELKEDEIPKDNG